MPVPAGPAAHMLVPFSIYFSATVSAGRVGGAPLTFLRPKVLSTTAFGAVFGWSFFLGGIVVLQQGVQRWRGARFAAPGLFEGDRNGSLGPRFPGHSNPDCRCVGKQSDRSSAGRYRGRTTFSTAWARLCAIAGTSVRPSASFHVCAC